MSHPTSTPPSVPPPSFEPDGQAGLNKGVKQMTTAYVRFNVFIFFHLTIFVQHNFSSQNK